MKFWLCITNSDNWKVIKEKNVWGVSDRHKNTIARVEVGDKLAVYGISEKIGDKILEPRIYGIFEAKSTVFRDSKKIFKGQESYPNRVKLEPLYVPERFVPFKPLIEKLTFIKNKKRWNTHLYGRAMREIPKKDYEVIENAVRQYLED